MASIWPLWKMANRHRGRNGLCMSILSVNPTTPILLTTCPMGGQSKCRKWRPELGNPVDLFRYEYSTLKAGR